MPSYPNPLELTGRRRHRKGWFGKMILQVEQVEKFAYADNDSVAGETTSLVWRDAVIGDMGFLNWYERDKIAKLTGAPPPPPPERYAIL